MTVVIIADPEGMARIMRDHPQIEPCEDYDNCGDQITYQGYVEDCDLYPGHAGWHVLYRESCEQGHFPDMHREQCSEGCPMDWEAPFRWDRAVPAMAWGVG